jgi:hypothetical protein
VTPTELRSEVEQAVAWVDLTPPQRELVFAGPVDAWLA